MPRPSDPQPPQEPTTLRLVRPPAVAHGITLPSTVADPSEGGDTLGLNAATTPGPVSPRWYDTEPDLTWRRPIGTASQADRPAAQQPQPRPPAFYADAAEMEAAEFPSQAHAYRSGWRWGVVCGLLFGCVAMAGLLALGLRVG